MRWLVLVLVTSLVACEPRVIVTRTPAAQSGGPSASGGASPTARASATPAKLALRQIPNVTTPSRLVSYERGGDIGQPTLRFLVTDDGRVITEETSGDLVQRKLTPSGSASMVLQAIQTGLFQRDADFGRAPLPGTTPPARGTTVLIFVVANGTRDVRVSVVPTGQPDDELYQRSPERDKLTALARGYEDLAWVPASSWAEATPRPYQAAVHRIFVLAQPGAAPAAGSPDADALWPFLTPIDGIGEVVTGGSATLPWRCAVLVDDDARALGDALARGRAISRYESGTRMATATLGWRGGTGTVRLQLSPLLPHEPATCAGAAPPI
ncbi:MAG TPA: hypothetical protein VGS01_00845 [Candidatus Limnocylindria bacterium]|nr:hypothetical protein [Candidatus Limnocylindria bacterium]